MPGTDPALHPDQQEVLILAPTGQDARLLRGALENAGMSASIFPDMRSLCERLRGDAGSILIAEEALNATALTHLNQILAKQEPWSDIPLTVMTNREEASVVTLRTIRSFTPLGNVTLVERPFRPITLVSLLQVAQRARRRQYQVRELLAAQVQATQIRDEFISIASHELKTPLTSLRLQAQISERQIRTENPDAYSPDRVRRMIRNTNAQVDRLARLVEDMLDVSRINTGKLVIEKTEFDLAELVRDVVERFSSQLSEVDCPVELRAEPLVGNWDRYRIEQVVSNLITNVMRYARGCAVKITLDRHAERARLSFHDRGPGISPESFERIFHRFERAVNAHNISGLGLGLYISRQIVESHGGTIHVESAAGSGANFIIQLPLKS